MADWESVMWILLELTLLYYKHAMNMNLAMGFIVSVGGKN